LERVVVTPCSRPTSCCFGGGAFATTLFVTSCSLVWRRRLQAADTRAESAWFQSLKQRNDQLLSSFAFKFNLSLYRLAVQSAGPTSEENAKTLLAEEPLAGGVFAARAYTCPLISSTQALFVGYVRQLQ